MNLGNKIINSIQKKTCKLVGHNWKYQDYSNYMKCDGNPYEFKASRHCPRCNQYAYFYKSWNVEEKSPLDFAGYAYGISKKQFEKLMYSENHIKV